MKPRVANQKNRGLTLIEVLLIVAVLSVVLSMFLPVYEASHRRQTAFACQNNLKVVNWLTSVGVTITAENFPWK